MTDRDEARTILLDVMEESALEVASVIAAHRFDDQAVWKLMHGLDAGVEAARLVTAVLDLGELGRHGFLPDAQGHDAGEVRGLAFREVFTGDGEHSADVGARHHSGGAREPVAAGAVGVALQDAHGVTQHPLGKVAELEVDVERVLVDVAGLMMPPNKGVYTWGVVAVAVIGVIAGFGKGVTGRFDGALVNDRNHMSLSQFQTAIWTVVVGSAYLTAALSNIALGVRDPLGIAVPTQLWILMGISITSLAGTPMLLDPKKGKEAHEDDVEEAASPRRRRRPGSPSRSVRRRRPVPRPSRGRRRPERRGRRGGGRAGRRAETRRGRGSDEC